MSSEEDLTSSRSIGVGNRSLTTTASGGGGAGERIQLRAIINPQPQRTPPPQPPRVPPKPFQSRLIPLGEGTPTIVTAGGGRIAGRYDADRMHPDESDELLESPPPTYPQSQHLPPSFMYASNDVARGGESPQPLQTISSTVTKRMSQQQPHYFAMQQFPKAGITEAGVSVLPRTLQNGTDGAHGMARVKGQMSIKNGVGPPIASIPSDETALVDDDEQNLDENDLEVMDALNHVINRSVDRVAPNKSNVLMYFAAATNFRLKRIGSELQVTDADGYPLFDVWVDMSFCQARWIVEAYGKLVLYMIEKPASPVVGCCSRARRPPIAVFDWNGDTLGYLLPGDPFVLQSSEKQPIAKLLPHITNDIPPSVTGSVLNVGGDQLLGGGGNIPCSSSTSVPPIAAAVDPIKRMCWLCVLEGGGRHIARLEGFDAIQYNKDVAFQLKLITLAAIIRLSAPWNLPGRGDNRYASTLPIRMVSTLLNCCAYCFY